MLKSESFRYLWLIIHKYGEFVLNDKIRAKWQSGEAHWEWCCDINLSNTLNNNIKSCLKISFICCYKFIYNFKYIYIDQMSFIQKKIVTSMVRDELTQ